MKTKDIVYQGNLRNIFYLFQDRSVYSDETIEKLFIVVENQKNKIFEDYHSFSIEKELLRELIISHVEYSTANQQGLSCVKLRKEKQKLCDELEKKLGEDMMEKVEKIFYNCDKLVNSGLKLKKKYGLTINFDEEGKITYNIQGNAFFGNVNAGSNANFGTKNITYHEKRLRRDSWEESSATRNKIEQLELMEIDNQELQSQIQINPNNSF